jgi:hypothetical protein
MFSRSDLDELVAMEARPAIRRGTDTDAFLATARQLIDDGAFWRHQQRGLALFLAPCFIRIHTSCR